MVLKGNPKQLEIIKAHHFYLEALSELHNSNFISAKWNVRASFNYTVLEV